MTQEPAAPTAQLPANLHSALAKALAAQGYETLTPVQQAMLDPAHETADLLVSAQTGSGKTVAFGLSIAPTLLGDAQTFDAPEAVLGLVIAPTRELAMQVQRELGWLFAETQIRIATAVGGMDMRTERRALERGAHLVVGTPGRLRDHISKGVLGLEAVRAVVLDEADEMLDLGFREDLEFILGSAPAERRTLMFSATVPRAIADLAKTYQRDAIRVVASAERTQHADIAYQLMLVDKSEREHAIINTLLNSDSKSAMVFCHTREAVRHLTARLSSGGFAVVALSGELAQSERSSALQAMRDGRARVCVATDVAARGIDLPNLDLVIHADLPSNPDTLLHRSGRTGRAGRKGICVLVVPEHRLKAAQRVLGFANLSATLVVAPGIGEIEARYREQIVSEALEIKSAEEGEEALLAELIGRVSPEQLALAYLRQQIAARPVPEEITPVSLPTGGKPERREKRSREERFGKDDRFAAKERGAWDERPRAERNFEDAPPRKRREPMEGGAWFTLSVGRKHRADPKWLIPVICKAGGVTKRELGAIVIEDEVTRFEISAAAAGDFAAAIERPGAVEKGMRISADFSPEAGPDVGRGAPKRKPRAEGAPKWTEKPKAEGAGAGKPPFRKKGAPEGGPGGKPRSKPEGKFGGKPFATKGPRSKA